MTGTRDSREDRQLRQLARLCGVHTSYVDLTGARRHADREALRAVLQALGQPVAGQGGVAAALQTRRAELRAGLVEPVTVAWGEAPPVLRLRCPGDRLPERVTLDVELEDGTSLQRREELAAGPGGVAACQLSTELPSGVHRLHLELAGCRDSTTLIAAPRTAPAGSGAPGLGVFLPLYALRSARSWGTGDLTDLAALGRWAGRRGCGYVGTLPLLSSFLDAPCEPSPYTPVSRKFWNELYLDVTLAPELAHAPAAQQLLASDEVRREIERVRGTPLVEHRGAMAVKRRILDALAAAALECGARRAALESLVQEAPEALQYARFRAEVERRRATWSAWPAPARDGVLDAARETDPACATHLYAQLLMQEQLRTLSRRLAAAGSGLYLDLPIGVHPEGYDVWRHRELFVTGVSAGAPPDDFFPGGQSWGFPPLHPERIRQDGHRYLREVLVEHLRHASLLRIDHVMGMHRLYWVPDGLPATRGVYVSYPAEEQYALLCLEASRWGTRVVGENLGTVPPAVNEAMERHGLLRMAVAQFELRPDPSAALRPVARGTLVGLNTHDLPPFAAFWKGHDLRMRQELGWLAAEPAEAGQAHRAALRQAVGEWLRCRQELPEGLGELAATLRALLRELAAGDGEILMVNLEDLWLEEHPQNVPGTVDAYPCWQRRAARTLEELVRDPEAKQLLEDLARLRARLGASPGAAS